MVLHQEKSFVFEENPQAPSCHASTVLPLEDGRILAAWFAGSGEGAEDVGIWLSRQVQGAWEKPFRICAKKNTAHWNPVLHRALDGTIVLYFKVGRLISQWQTYYAVSRDGVCWSQPRELVPGDTSGGRGPVKNKCLRLSDGRLLAPASTEPGPEKWYAFMDCSPDDGFTWRRQQLLEPPEYRGEEVALIQPTLWQDAAGVHCLLRSNKGALYRSDSPDGETWNAPFRTALPNNNAGIDLAQDQQNRLWLVYNPVSGNWGRRSPLVLALSRDGGASFAQVLTLEAGEGEYSYPAIVAQGDALYITYTHNRQRIAFWKVVPAL